jgi:hypothetical protein
METRLTLRPGQDGTKKLVQRFGKRLVAVRYLYDADASRRYKTVELIVESQAWSPRPRRLRRTPDDIVAVRIRYHEAELRERAKALGGVWRPAHKLWELTWDAVRKLDIADRVAGTRTAKAVQAICK